MSKISWTLRVFRLSDLTDYYKNPRTLSEKEFKQLRTSLDKFGMIDKLIINADPANTIIGGHQRKRVLESLGITEAECWIPDRELSDKEAEELNIRLNKNTGQWDFDVLANEFEANDLIEWGFAKEEFGLTIDHQEGDRAGASPWERMNGESADGVLFQFGAITCRVDQSIYEKFLSTCPDDNIAEYIAELFL